MEIRDLGFIAIDISSGKEVNEGYGYIFAAWENSFYECLVSIEKKNWEMWLEDNPDHKSELYIENAANVEVVNGMLNYIVEYSDLP